MHLHRTATMRPNTPVTDAEIQQLISESMNRLSDECVAIFERLIRERGEAIKALKESKP